MHLHRHSPQPPQSSIPSPAWPFHNDRSTLSAMPKRTPQPVNHRSLTFIDVFAGCGGLSLGLMQSGWKGLFAIEKDPNAFASLEANLVQERGPLRPKFAWPDAIPQTPLSIDNALRRYRPAVGKYSGQLDLLVGGPPCQGFSTAGRRDPNDPRNQLVRSYLNLVDLLRPRMVLIENVKGITADFSEANRISGPRNYAELIKRSLAIDYDVFTKVLDTSKFGVPQRRHRFFIIAFRKGAFKTTPCPFEHIESTRLAFLESKGLRSIPVSTRSAISDLEVTANGTRLSGESSGFIEIKYKRKF